jgi:acetoin utilization protein AcuB
MGTALAAERCMALRDHSHMPPVGQVMTAFPYFVQVTDTLIQVRALMEEHDFRHIPVKDGENTVGVISQRDLDRWVHPAAPESDLEKIHAGRIMTPDPYHAAYETPLAEVLETMADRRIGTVLVVRGSRLAGIFTTTDACDLLAELLRERFDRVGVA